MRAPRGLEEPIEPPEPESPGGLCAGPPVCLCLCSCCAEHAAAREVSPTTTSGIQTGHQHVFAILDAYLDSFGPSWLSLSPSVGASVLPLSPKFQASSPSFRGLVVADTGPVRSSAAWRWAGGNRGSLPVDDDGSGGGGWWAAEGGRWRRNHRTIPGDETGPTSMKGRGGHSNIENQEKRRRVQAGRDFRFGGSVGFFLDSCWTGLGDGDFKVGFVSRFPPVAGVRDRGLGRWWAGRPVSSLLGHVSLGLVPPHSESRLEEGGLPRKGRTKKDVEKDNWSPHGARRVVVTAWEQRSGEQLTGSRCPPAAGRPASAAGGTGGVAELLTSGETRVGVMNASVHFSWTQLVEYPSTHISWADQKLGRKDVLLLRVHLADADMSSDCRFLYLSSSFPRLSNPPPAQPPPPQTCCKSGGTRSLNGSKGEAKVDQSHR